MAARERQGAAAPGRRTGEPLTRDQVLAAALEVVEHEGVDRLTVRGLAARLGVAVTAIYWHVGDKQALLDGVVDLIIERTGGVRARGRTPQARLLSTARSLRRSLLDRPDLVAVVHRQGRIAALFQPARLVLAREFVAAGVSEPEVAMAVRAIVNLVVGSVLIDRQVERQPAQREDLVDLRAVADTPGSPELLEALTRPVDEEALFDYSLRALVSATVPKR